MARGKRVIRLKAASPGHKLGQMIGNFLEDVFDDHFSEFAVAHKLYLDKKGPRTARGARRKVTWHDSDGNAHDLDYVLELNGGDGHIGDPVAFIEFAWRRYTKHSRNKSGEIEASLLHLGRTYHKSCRFLGAILAGEYSSGGLQQLRSHRIVVLFVPHTKLFEAFAVEGIDLDYAEDAEDNVKRQIIAAWQALHAEAISNVGRVFRDSIRSELEEFTAALQTALSREVRGIRILALYGEALHASTAKEGIRLLEGYDTTHPSALVHNKFEILISFHNDDEIRGSFSTKEAAVDFLSYYL